MGHRIKKIRMEKGISQEQLAKESGVSRTIISMIENDEDHNAKSSTLKKLAAALGVSFGELFFGENAQ